MPVLRHPVALTHSWMVLPRRLTVPAHLEPIMLHPRILLHLHIHPRKCPHLPLGIPCPHLHLALYQHPPQVRCQRQRQETLVVDGLTPHLRLHLMALPRHQVHRDTQPGTPEVGITKARQHQLQDTETRGLQACGQVMMMKLGMRSQRPLRETYLCLCRAEGA